MTLFKPQTLPHQFASFTNTYLNRDVRLIAVSGDGLSQTSHVTHSISSNETWGVSWGNKEHVDKLKQSLFLFRDGRGKRTNERARLQG